MYISSITDGLSSLPAGDPVLREGLMKKDIEELYNELAAVDPQAALDIHKIIEEE